MAASILTAARLREVLHYDPETGVFTRLKYRGGRHPLDGRVGSIEDGYIRISVDNKLHKAHRLAWLYANGSWPEGPLDHRNGIRSDNRLSNLRLATTLVNSQNLRLCQDGNESGLLGVSRTRTGAFAANIRVVLGGKCLQLYLGRHATAEEAHAVYVDAKRRMHDGCTI